MVMLSEFNIFYIRHFFSTGIPFGFQNLCFKRFKIFRMEKVVFKISVTVFQISPIALPLLNFHSLFLVSLEAL